jgi:hypothetical protein
MLIRATAGFSTLLNTPPTKVKRSLGEVKNLVEMGGRWGSFGEQGSGEGERNVPFFLFLFLQEVSEIRPAPLPLAPIF